MGAAARPRAPSFSPRRCGARASCAAQTPPLRGGMEKLAVGAENWSVDTLAPSVDLGIPGSGFLFSPPFPPKMEHTRLAQGSRTPRQAAVRNSHAYPFPAPNCPTSTVLSFDPTSAFFVLFFSSPSLFLSLSR